jgi:uncharacterized protein YprB with RNaseH-like and TPR domain
MLFLDIETTDESGRAVLENLLEQPEVTALLEHNIDDLDQPLVFAMMKSPTKNFQFKS